MVFNTDKQEFEPEVEEPEEEKLPLWLKKTLYKVEKKGKKKMDKKAQNIGIGVGAIVGISVASVLGIWYYKKAKEQAKIDEMPKEEDNEKDLYYDNNHENLIYPRKSRFNVFDNPKVSDRFKIMETLGDDGVEVRGVKRLRVSGNIHRRTEGGYSGNRRRNANFSDLIIP